MQELRTETVQDREDTDNEYTQKPDNPPTPVGVGSDL
jgi:hypothetical protein